MARKRVVSRTIPKLEATIAVADIAKGVIENESIELPSGAKSPKAALKYAQKQYEADANKSVLKIVSINKTDVHYEMDEADFIKAARVTQ